MKTAQFVIYVLLSFVTFHGQVVGAETAAPASQNDATQPLSAIVYTGADNRDPFIPLIGPDGALKFSFSSTDIVIEGIIYDPTQGSLALIDGDLYKEGDFVKGANIISIFQNHVILEQETEERTIWIRDEVVEEQNVTTNRTHGA